MEILPNSFPENYHYVLDKFQPCNPNFMLYQKRINFFLSSQCSIVLVKELATCGFYYNEYSEEIQCFYCNYRFKMNEEIPLKLIIPHYQDVYFY